MGKKALIVTVSCIFMLCLTQRGASAACLDDCFASCCGSEGVCNDPVTVGCLVICAKDCDGQSASAGDGKEKSSPNAIVQQCQQDHRNRVRWCDYPRREVQAHRQCLEDARHKFDDCMAASGR